MVERILAGVLDTFSPGLHDVARAGLRASLAHCNTGLEPQNLSCKIGPFLGPLQ